MPQSRGQTAAAAATPAIGVTDNFHGDDLATQLNAFGTDQKATPPDTTMATGNGFVVEPLNFTLSTYSTAGVLRARTDLFSFYGTVLPPGHTLSDPQAVFDPVTSDHRFYLSILGFNPSTFDSEVLLAVSQTSDPTGSWYLYDLGTTKGVLQDQPFLGMSDDKLTISVNDLSTSSFLGSTTYVVNKAEADTGGTIHVQPFGPDPYFRPSPARSTSSTTTQYVVANDSPSLDVMAITGVPSSATAASRTVSTLSIASTITPPDALQPSGPAIATGDNRLLEAVWQNNQLWVGANDGCTPPGDFERSCLRLIELAAPTTGPPSVSRDFDEFATGGYLYYPGTALDVSQDLYVPLSASNTSSSYPSAFVLTLPGGDPTTSTAQALQSGVQYNGIDSASPAVRWGDYSGAAIDTSDPTAVWVAAEFGGGSTSLGPGTNWATQISRVNVSTLPGPSVVGVEGADNALWVRSSGAGGFTGLGGVLTGAPAIAAVPQASGAPLPLYIVTGSDHRLWVRNDTKGFQPLTSSPTNCVDNPAAVVTGSPGSTTLTVACQGSDHGLWMIQGPVSGTSLPTLSGWTGLGGILAAGPAVAPVGGALTFLALGTDGHVWLRTTSTGFTQMPWTCLGHPALATSATASTFACDGTDHALWYATNNGVTGWSRTTSAGGILVDGPGVAATSTGTTFYVEGSDSALWQNFVPNGGNPTGWTGDGGVVRQGAGGVGLG